LERNFKKKRKQYDGKELIDLMTYTLLDREEKKKKIAWRNYTVVSKKFLLYK